jgi:hypothetical protein
MKTFSNIKAAILLAAIAHPSFAQGIQTPAVVAGETQLISERFTQVLEEECPINICNSVGCETSRFVTLDESQDSSLPGMGAAEPSAKTVQYKLAGVKCEFAYEPTFDETKLAALRQRLLQRVKQGGVNLVLVSRKLLPKADLAAPVPPPPPAPKIERLNRSDLLAQEFAPFLPWITILFLLGTFALTAIFIRYRHKIKKSLATFASGDAPAPEGPTISAEQLLERTAYVRRIYQEDPALSEFAMRSLLEQSNLDELCRILKHFGPELFATYKQRGQFESTLEALAVKYQDYSSSDTPEKFWEFLERSERRLTAAKVGVNIDPLSYEFAFMERMQVDELIGLMGELTELEGLAIIVNGPQGLRQELFASAGSAFVAKFIKYLTGQERLSDQFVRQAVQKARLIYGEKGGTMKIVAVNKLPLLEDALNSLDSKQRAALLGEIQKDQPQVLNVVATRIFLDASLAKLPDDILTEAFLLVTPKAAAAYIDSLEGQVEVLQRLKPRLQDAIKQFMGSPLLDRSLVKEARQTISQFIKDKDKQGTIDLGKINNTLFS